MVGKSSATELPFGAALRRVRLAAGFSQEELGLEAVVQDLGMGYETRLAAAGENLSGGQRQLLLLTACLASQRKIILLDEAMAGLDWGRRARLAHSSLLRQKTILYASHDGSPIPSGS